MVDHHHGISVSNRKPTVTWDPTSHYWSMLAVAMPILSVIIVKSQSAPAQPAVPVRLLHRQQQVGLLPIITSKRDLPNSSMIVAADIVSVRHDLEDKVLAKQAFAAIHPVPPLLLQIRVGLQHRLLAAVRHPPLASII